MPEKMKAAVFLQHEYLPCFADRHMEFLRREAPQVEWVNCLTLDEFRRELADSGMAVCWSFALGAVDAAPKLVRVATPAAGREFIRLTPRPGLEVIHGTFHGEFMGETVVGLMLAFARGIKDSLDRRAEPWPRVPVTLAMRPLRGSRAVIVGFGHIGKWIGRLVKPFGVRLVGVNRSDLSRPDYFDGDDAVCAVSELDRHLSEADHLILALPFSADTDMLLDARRLALLPPRAYVYNVGRGNAVDEPALIAALKAGRLAGAGLDVYAKEPLEASSPIRDCPNVILMPHVSAMSVNYLDVFFRELVKKI